MRRDPLIIGGGPAGAAAAITLGRAGCRPMLIERTSGPVDKVCGDFLSADTLAVARALGVDPVALGAATITRLRLARGERVVEAELPFTAMGLSRRALDAALLRRAADSGAVVRAGLAVQRLIRDGTCWTAGMAGGAAIDAETVFLATGKHDVRDLPRPGAERGAVGMKMYYALAPAAARALERTIELTLFPGGYAGMQPVEAGRTVLCVAVQRRAFRRAGANWPGLLARIGAAAPHFSATLEGAVALLPRPLAVAGIPYGLLRAADTVSGGLFRLGDQAAVIPSLTGDGMAIALHSGALAARVWLEGGDAATYHRELACGIGRQMRLARLLHRAFLAGPVQSAVVGGAAWFPGLLRQAARATRLAPEAVLAGG